MSCSLPGFISNSNFHGMADSFRVAREFVMIAHCQIGFRVAGESLNHWQRCFSAQRGQCKLPILFLRRRTASSRVQRLCAMLVPDCINESMRTNMAAPDKNSSAGSLAGIRVIELADEQAEYCGLPLAGLGADVIKVE